MITLLMCSNAGVVSYSYRVHCITGRHFLSVNGQMLAQSIPTPTMEAIIKNKGKVKLGPHSVTVISN